MLSDVSSIRASTYRILRKASQFPSDLSTMLYMHLDIFVIRFKKKKNFIYGSSSPSREGGSGRVSLPLAVRERQICQAGMKNSNNITAFNSVELVHSCYLIRIFRQLLTDLAGLTAKRSFFSNIYHFCLYAYLPFLTDEIKILF